METIGTTRYGSEADVASDAVQPRPRLFKSFATWGFGFLPPEAQSTDFLSQRLSGFDLLKHCTQGQSGPATTLSSQYGPCKTLSKKLKNNNTAYAHLGIDHTKQQLTKCQTPSTNLKPATPKPNFRCETLNPKQRTLSGLRFEV